MKIHDKPILLTRKPNFGTQPLISGLVAGTASALLLAPTISAEESDIDKITDFRANDAIEHALLFETSVPSYKLDVTTIDGITTISGTVENLLAKERAIKAAKATRGVRSVIDKIEVNAPKRTDVELAADVTNALILDPATEAFEVNVEAKDGSVTLMGTVDSWQERQIALHVAKGIVGVNEVVDSMKHEYDTDRSDRELADEINRTLQIDVILRPLLISTEVNNGTVSLMGTVGSSAEKDRAISKSYVTGVKTVDASGLKVDSWASADMTRKEFPAIKSDEDVKEAVVDSMLYDPRVASFKPEVRVDNGFVTLTGTVDSIKAKEAAELDAKNTVGVRRVDNLLKVRTNEKMEDSTVSANLEAALVWNSITQAHEIEVDVRNGVATLTGTVDSFLERIEAEDVAKRTTGVLDVKNKIKVDMPELTYYSYTFDPIWATRPHYTFNKEGMKTWPAISDAQIIENIEDELFWSPFVDSNDVNVDVKFGEVTLKGTVDDYSEYRDATENAYEGGATSVINELKIQ